MKKQFDLSGIDEVAKVIVQTARNKVLCFYGDMGTGKTTLIKSLLKELGAQDTGNSPTFGLVNEYHDANENLLAFHFDFYRIKDESEALDMGWEDYLSSGAWVFVEWPEKIASLLPEETSEVHLHFIDENTRSVEFNAY
ncbi:tRNA (adenosine(37)-N6)-threonylcarbamoyltransferase complex ATPase subunit type 1 TsaE [Muricauda sp. JGD-17]|uniref:tRNA threonylcarbamoyladenosine biosynthesis protein TsaE n=1 Tax=Flagellimonas ochracea TaxID=2696472 RepID=A0A964TA21_9FLAO|nr:tRNA (adenosine(37)-N6)-threonylcarbamoyltransferase complex ATPase subunit type 1 TsaE [Allomuricauda ochracea]NAY91018.1 tRNA (adenosine(37)-N6)-threonylcarbamoyltransferase complex ATPase subunit type 1 TsaE [Allomuricauda ochracea]